jgi:hypothetical protein
LGPFRRLSIKVFTLIDVHIDLFLIEVAYKFIEDRSSVFSSLICGFGPLADLGGFKVPIAAHKLASGGRRLVILCHLVDPLPKYGLD